MSQQDTVHLFGDAACQPVLPSLCHRFRVDEVARIFGGCHLDDWGWLPLEQGTEQFLEHDDFLSDSRIVPKG
ncbi:hypothetical protein D3C85_1791840 [compost metagenome]